MATEKPILLPPLPPKDCPHVRFLLATAAIRPYHTFVICSPLDQPQGLRRGYFFPGARPCELNPQ
jgi:hypothetical protein